ncbi:MAG: hypothetical protein ACXW2U_16030 [Telluria sp.]
MIERQLDPAASVAGLPDTGRRQHAANEDQLFLSELNPRDVVDGLGGSNDDPATFGAVRETCPKCRHTHLRLVLRQQTVRMAHLFCANCESCFDAFYANGSPALTI